MLVFPFPISIFCLCFLPGTHRNLQVLMPFITTTFSYCIIAAIQHCHCWSYCRCLVMHQIQPTVEVFSQQQSEISTRNSDCAGGIVFPHLTSENLRKGQRRLDPFYLRFSFFRYDLKDVNNEQKWCFGLIVHVWHFSSSRMFKSLISSAQMQIAASSLRFQVSVDLSCR